MLFGFDPVYFVFVAPALLRAAWASWRVQRAYAEAREVPPASGFTGAQAAEAILDRHGLTGVLVEPTDRYTSDHYDPTDKVLRLSPGVYAGRSLAALGIAAHEAGHALQDAAGYPLVRVGKGISPLAAVAGNVSWVLILAGFLLAAGGSLLGTWLIWL